MEDSLPSNAAILICLTTILFDPCNERFLIYKITILIIFAQSQLPSDMESVLLQQVLNLTPEQLSSLPPEQQQQVIQLQQALKRDQMQHS